jgi:hypothetical protein
MQRLLLFRYRGVRARTTQRVIPQVKPAETLTTAAMVLATKLHLRLLSVTGYG